jgi:tetratricopeptide (TPR) repeat protein
VSDEQRPIAETWVEHLYLQAQTLLGQGDVPGAIAAYRRAIQIADGSPTLHAGLAATLDQAGDLNGALREYLRAQQLNPINPTYARAIESLRRRLGGMQTRGLAGAVTVPLDGKLPPAPDPIPAALIAVARAVRSNEVSPKDRAWVIAALRVALRSDPENERLHVKLSNLLQAEGDRLGAAAHMREANRLSRLRIRRRA